jgi:hypothetical protein
VATQDSQLVWLDPARAQKWINNFSDRHGAGSIQGTRQGVLVTAPDGSWANFSAAFATSYDETPQNLGELATWLGDVAMPPADWGILLVRKGGFAVARMATETMASSKVGQRHVQGRSKAGGQSQQRFARRREHQAQAAYAAATQYCVDLLGTGTLPVLIGGDRAAIRAVYSDPRLCEHQLFAGWLTIAAVNRRALEESSRQGQQLQVQIWNAS